MPYPPTVNTLYGNKANGKGRYLTDRGKEFKETVQLTCMLKKTGYIEGEIVFSIDVFRPRKSGDLDNLIKSLQDSLEGICYKNDNQIVEIHARRFEDAKNPRVEIKLNKSGREMVECLS